MDDANPAGAQEIEPVIEVERGRLANPGGVRLDPVPVNGLTDHPEHRAIADWTELPPHIHHRTDTLAPFLAAIGAALSADKTETSPTSPLRAQFCLT